MKKEIADKMTVQELCDYSIKKLVRQGKKCVNTSNLIERCVYKDAKGNHCAIGWLLDEDNNELMKFQGTVTTLIELYPEFIPEPIKDDLDVFKTLQTVHDIWSGSDRFYEHLKFLNHLGVDTSGPHWEAFIGIHNTSKA